jgi:RNA polymerase sigma factor (sigma-70 family)
VRQLLQALPEVDRTVFLLHSQHELTYTEIAQMTGVTVAAAKVKVHRVRLKLAASGLKEMV